MRHINEIIPITLLLIIVYFTYVSIPFIVNQILIQLQNGHAIKVESIAPGQLNGVIS